MLDHRIAELASRQYGLFSRGQVMALGGTDDVINQRLGAARWEKRVPGVYGLPGWPESWRRSLWLAHLDIGPDSVVSHEAAARPVCASAATRLASVTLVSPPAERWGVI